VIKIGKLPKKTPVGKVVTIRVRGKPKKFKRIAKKGFPQWRIIK